MSLVNPMPTVDTHQISPIRANDFFYSKARSLSHPLGESYSEKYNYYDTSKYDSNYLYDSTKYEYHSLRG